MTTKPSKTDQYLAEAQRFGDMVNAHREAPTPAPKKRRSYPLPLQDRPSSIPGFPLNPDPPTRELPQYHSIAFAPSPATRAAQAERARHAERLGKLAPLRPTGPSELRKAGTSTREIKGNQQ